MQTINRINHTSLLLLSGLSAILALASCDQKGSAEKAGQKIDQAAAKTDQKIDQIGEKAGKEIDTIKSKVEQKTDAAGEYLDDSVITTKIKEALIKDELLKVTQIEVSTVNGVVKLSGAVDSEEQIGRALGLVNSQQHVKSVQNELTLAPKTESK